MINNVCFPSQVSETYGSKGRGLCCVTILESTLEKYEGQHDVLDNTIRQELAGWFPDYHDEIDNQWKRERMYIIQNAQPRQYRGPAPAHFNGGRDCTTFMGAALPQGIFVCGDHMVSIQPRNMIFYCSFLLFDLRFSLGYCNTERSYRKWQKRWSSSSNWTITYFEL